jgi:hypothetical protein
MARPRFSTDATFSHERMVQIEGGADPTDDELRDISDAVAVPVSMLRTESDGGETEASEGKAQPH